MDYEELSLIFDESQIEEDELAELIGGLFI